MPALPLVLFFLAALAARILPAEEPPAITIEPGLEGVRILADGELFAEYHTDSAGRPVVWPLVGPSGVNLLREWPIGDPAPGEATDHPHHRGMWFGYDQMNEIDFWHNAKRPYAKGRRGRIVHRGFSAAKSDGRTAIVATRNDWVGPQGELVCQDKRTLRFGAGRGLRWVDFSITLMPAGGPLRIGDSKEGAFAVRVADWLREDAERGGRIVTSEGLDGARAWGQRAAWVDYHGSFNGVTAGLAIFSHPDNPRPRPRWHVRGYGLFAANPFGETDFPPIPGYQQGAITLEIGEELRLRYRVLLHPGDKGASSTAKLFREYADR